MKTPRVAQPWIVGGRRRLIAAACALTVLAIVAGSERAVGMSVPEQTGLSGAALVKALRHGGYVIYFRHTETDHSRTDSDRESLENCETQRTLSNTGRAQARAIGRAFKRLGIPVARVETSPYCRCIETGTLAFGDVSVSDDLRSTISGSREETIASADALRKRLAEPPPPGTNTVLVSHTSNLKEAAGIWPDPEGVAIVFRPEDGAEFSFVAAVPPEQWTTLARE
jgi:phosphohistidine phosphatase SixA